MRTAESFDMNNSESSLSIGRVVAALASDPDIMRKCSKVLAVAKEALEDDIQDIDGRQPGPLTIHGF
jgi:dehydrogenase/reductase SDR family member 1